MQLFSIVVISVLGLGLESLASAVTKDSDSDQVFRRLQLNDCETASTDWIICLTTNCADTSCETNTGDAGTAGYTGPESCDGLVQGFCNGFDDTCCLACAAETRNMRDCTLQSTLAIVCADASCDGDSVSSGTTTNDATPVPAPSGGATTPEVGDGSDVQGSTQSTGTTSASGSFTDDIVICKEETTELEQCASENCPTCEDVLGDNDEGAATGFDCAEIEKDFCTGVSEGKECCPDCKGEVDKLYTCTLPLLNAFCPDIGCDGVSSSGSGNKNVNYGFAALALLLTATIV